MTPYFTEYYGNPSAKSVLITFGRSFSEAVKCYDKLKQEGIKLAILKLNKIYPINEKIYEDLKKFNNIYIFEEGIASGGINETICAGIIKNSINAKVHITAIKDEFIPHMSVNSALNKYNLTADTMYQIIKEEENERK
jgi:deoxyxylulose-5-phosphate synthase